MQQCEMQAAQYGAATAQSILRGEEGGEVHVPF